MKPTTVIEGDSQATLAGADASALQIPGDINIFKAQYGRAGDDLVIEAEGSAPLTVIDYFSAGTPAALVAPSGAQLTGDVVELLAGPRAPGQYAQAGEPDLGTSIGRVETLTGSATVTRVTGEVVELVPGQPVYLGDVVETGADTKLGLMIVDGTIAAMSSDSRMVLNELVYDPGGSTNSMLVSLVQGGFAFITGAVAGSGGMDIRTPVAVMAIRGTIPAAELHGDQVKVYTLSDSVFDLYDLAGQLLTEIRGEFEYLLGPGGAVEVRPIDPETAERLNLLLEQINNVATQLGLEGADTKDGFVPFSNFGNIDGNTTAADVQWLVEVLELIEAAELENNDENDDEDQIQLVFAEQEEPPPPEPAPIADNVAASGDEDANSIAIVLSGSDGVESFTITSLPANGTLYADAGLTTPLQVGDEVAANGNTATVYFVPDENWNGQVSFTYTASDGVLISDPATATITVNPINDAAVISGDTSGTVVEDAVPNTVSGDLNHTDADGDNDDDVWQPVAAGTASDEGYGSYEMDAAGNWTYTLDNGHADVQGLNEGDTLTDTFTVYTEDGTPQQVTITIEGTADAAVISGDTSGTVVEDAVPNTVSGDLNHTDADGDNDDDVWQPVAAGTASDEGYGSYEMDAAGNWTYTLDNGHADVQGLNEGDTLTDTFTVYTEDGTPQQVTITIEGTADAAVISGDTSGTVVEDAVPNTVSGDLNHTDADGDNDDDVWQPVAAGTASDEGYGSYEMDAAGNWTYTLDNGHADVQGLNEGDTLTDTFTVYTEDGTPQQVTITIEGTADAAVISGDMSGTVVEDAVPNTVSGDLNHTDADGDNDDDVWQPVAAGTASDEGYGSYEMDAAGNWTYTLDNGHADVQGLNEGDTLTDTFTVYTEDGTPQQVTITIEGTADAAVISGDTSGTVVEDAVPNTVSGDLNHTDADGDNDDDVWQPVAAGTASDEGYGSYEMDAAGNWTYTLDNGHADVQGLNEGDTLTDTFTVYTEDGTPQQVTITIEGTADAAVISGDTSGTVVEDAVPNTVSGDLNHTDADGDNDDDVWQPVAAGTASDEGYGSYEMDAAGNWTYTLDNGHADVQGLNEGDTLTDTFTVYTEDGTPQQVTITIEGTADAAVISGDTSGTVVEDAVPNTVSGDLNHTDADGDNDDDVWQPVAAGTASDEGYGSYEMDAAGNWTYTLDNGHADVQGLNEGDTLTDTFTVYTEDGTPQQVTITIEGTADAAVISGDTSGTVVEDAVPNTVSGDLNHTDADGDNDDDVWQPVAAGTASDEGYGSYEMDAAGNWTYTLDNGHADVQGLNEGDTLTDTFTVYTEDGTPQQVTITIEGTADAAVISGDTSGTVVEDAVPNTVSGDLNHTDADGDNDDDVWQPVAAGTASDEGYGSYEMDAAGNWTYTLDNGHADVQGLNEGDTLTDTFTVYTEDGTPQQVTITIEGTADAAVISGDTSGTVVEDAVPNTVSGDLNHTDADGDNDDDVWQPVAAGTASDEGYGSYEMDAAGNWTYTLDNGHADVQGLNEGDTLTDTFTVYTEDGTPQQVTITIEGTADAAVISGDMSGTVVEDAVPNTVSGDLNHTDADGDNDDDVWQPVAAGTASDEGYGSYEMDAAGNWTYTLDNGHADVQGLNEGDTLTDTFTVYTEDGTPQQVTITIEGTADAAVISGDMSGTVVEDAVPNTVSGDLNHTDADGDNDDDVWQPVAAGTASDEGYGSYEMDAAGNWTYTLDNGHADVQGLNEGDTLTDTFTVYTEDGTPQQVTITIEGTTDVEPEPDVISFAVLNVDDPSSNEYGSDDLGTQHPRLFAIVGDGDQDLESEETAYRLSNNLNSEGGLLANNDDNDPVVITANGPLANGGHGDQTNAVTFANETGFGVNDLGGTDKPTDSYLNDNESITFRLTGGLVLAVVAFTVNAAAGSADVTIDIDGEIAADGFSLGTLNDGDEVVIDFEQKKIWVNGVEQEGTEEFFAAAEGTDQITIGSASSGGDGFAIQDLQLTPAEPTPSDLDDPNVQLAATSADFNHDSESPNDPIILDLGEEGIEMTSTAAFDLNNDGQLQTLAWPNGEDGILVMDLAGAAADRAVRGAESMGSGAAADPAAQDLRRLPADQAVEPADAAGGHRRCRREEPQGAWPVALVARRGGRSRRAARKLGRHGDRLRYPVPRARPHVARRDRGSPSQSRRRRAPAPESAARQRPAAGAKPWHDEGGDGTIGLWRLIERRWRGGDIGGHARRRSAAVPHQPAQPALEPARTGSSGGGSRPRHRAAGTRRRGAPGAGVMSVAGQVRPALSIELLRVASGEQSIVVRSDAAGVRGVGIGPHAIPTDRNGQLWVNFSSHDPGRFISAIRRAGRPAGGRRARRYAGARRHLGHRPVRHQGDAAGAQHPRRRDPRPAAREHPQRRPAAPAELCARVGSGHGRGHLPPMVALVPMIGARLVFAGVRHRHHPVSRLLALV
jgi:VCBS repeat-containing protein